MSERQTPTVASEYVHASCSGPAMPMCSYGNGVGSGSRSPNITIRTSGRRACSSASAMIPSATARRGVTARQ